MAMEVNYLVRDPPEFPDIRQGWYKLDGRDEWWLTRNEVRKEFKVTEKKLKMLLATTCDKGINKGKLRTNMKLNPWNQRFFTVYSLGDLTMLFQDSWNLLLLPKTKQPSL